MPAALLATGHLRDACASGSSFNAAPLRRQIRLCEAAFGACDLFVHTWTTIAGDNCFWSAPPSALARSLHALSETYSALAADDARVTSCRRVRHPETLLACAMASADVCGRNLSAARAL